MTAESENQMKSRMTESDAILRARDGDSLGFEYLYNSHRKRVYSVCLRILKNCADAEDLTQQTFLQVFRKLGTFRGESGFSTWLHRVTINVVLMHLRRKKPTEARTEDLDSVELAADDASLLGAIDRLTLRRALHKLPVGYRKYFLLHDVIGYKHIEIAKILQCSTGCSKSQLHRARRRLRDLLQGESWRGQPDIVSA
jgi:RNA polymerase sigma-70 factor (ECF subfamily)